MPDSHGLYIDGARVDTPDTVPNINLDTGDVLGQFAQGSAALKMRSMPPTVPSPNGASHSWRPDTKYSGHRTN